MYFENIKFLYLMTLCILPLLAIIWETKNIKKAEKFIFRTKSETSQQVKILKIRIIIKNINFALCWFCISLACANPYWGIKVEPIQKSGNAVSFVFDISYSMTAKDEYNDFETISRLDYAKEYAHSILKNDDENSDAISASVIVAKGNAVTLVPQTEDYNTVFAAIDSLEPGILTSIGSNIASGLDSAMLSFQDEIARQNTIIVFTDCEETDGSIEKSLIQAAMKGINVFIIGFGSEEGTYIRAGKMQDTARGAKPQKIHTKLDEKVILHTINSAKEKVALKNLCINYYNAHYEKGKEHIDLVLYGANLNGANSVGSTSSTSNARSANGNSGTNQIIGYEAKNLSHHKLFTLLSIFFGLLALFTGFYKFSITHTAQILIFTVMTLSISMLSTGCKATVEQEILILQGSFYWHQGNYQKSEMKFLQVLNQTDENQNDFVYQYAVLGLGSSYAMQNEEISSFTRLKSIPTEAPQNIKFSANYNMGVLSFSQGSYNDAKEYFKKALEYNPDSIDAKINYELALWHREKDLQNKNSAQIESMNSHEILKNSIFSIIEENDRNIWKNQQKTSESQNLLDY